MKKAVIIACFYSYSYNTRLKYVQRALENLGYECIILAADFDHRTKTVNNDYNNNTVKYIHVTPYKKNLSFKRMWSHILFSDRAFKKTIAYKPDLVYVGAPPNSNVKKFSMIKKHVPNVKVFLSISDMWPETFPVNQRIKRMCRPVFKIWSNIRDNYISYYDGIMFECDLFKKYLSPYCRSKFKQTIYMAKEDILNYADSFTSRSLGSSRVIRFAYIGSVNNIIDIHLIVSLLSKINNHTKTELVIIGNGEKIDELKQMLLKSKIIVKDYGTVYSDEAKEKILVDCHYGLNVMKSSVFVGATMKSLDYLYFGLPLINTIVEDTWNLVNTEECGINLSENNVDFVAKRIIDMSEVDYSKMSENARIAFDRLFSVESVLNALESFFNRN